MKTVTSNWFEVKCSYEEKNENGIVKKVKKPYVVDAMTFTEAESRIIKSLPVQPVEVKEMKIASYKDIIISEDIDADKYFKVKVNLITFDDKTCLEKKTAVYHLVHSSNIEKARIAVIEEYKNSMSDYEISTIAETKIVEAYAYYR